MPTTTSTSGLIERHWFLAYSGIGIALRSELGSASSPSSFLSESSMSGVRCRIQIGLPRHSTVIFSPGFTPAMSTSTAAPAALAFSDGAKLLTKGVASAAAPAAPAHVEAMSQVRLLLSRGTGVKVLDGASLMAFLWRCSHTRDQPKIVAERNSRADTTRQWD